MEKISKGAIQNLLIMSSFVCAITTWAGMPLAYAKSEDVPVKQPQEKNKEAGMWANPLWDSQESLENWVPFQEMGKLQKDINQLFRKSMLEAERATGPMSQGIFSVRTDVRELPDKYVFTADIPGMDKDKIEISVTDQTLKISGERKNETEQTDKKGMYREERSFGYFERVFPLPRDIKTDQITSKYDRGVLTVELPKITPTSASEKGIKKIPIQ